MEMSDMLTMTGSYGFPIVVAGYLLVRMENVLKENTRVLNTIATKLEYLLPNKPV